ncbi:unnamed protein product, partial [Adineta steineri]
MCNGDRNTYATYCNTRNSNSIQDAMSCINKLPFVTGLAWGCVNAQFGKCKCTADTSYQNDWAHTFSEAKNNLFKGCSNSIEAERYEGNMYLTYTCSTHNPWELEIRFNKSANIQTSYGNLTNKINDQIFVYRQSSWNDYPKINTTFYFEFVADGDVKPSNIILVLFDRQPVNISLIIVPPLSIFPSKPINISTNNGTYDYGAVLYASILFYESQRSGRLPSNKRISWRSDSMLKDCGENGEDLTGGYFIDGSSLEKISSRTAQFTSVLAWGVIDYEDAYVKADQIEYVRDAIRWSTDYLIKAHVNEHEFYERVGDEEFWKSLIDDWSRPEDILVSRPTLKIDLNKDNLFVPGEAAAALAAASIVFRLSDPVYHSKLLTHARQLYNLAKNNNRHLFLLPSKGGNALAWAALWLLRATGEQSYLLDAKQHYIEFELDEYTHTIYEEYIRTIGVQVLMAKIIKEQIYRKVVERTCNNVVHNMQTTEKGLAYIDAFSKLKSTADMAFFCLQAADIGINTQEYLNFTTSQIGYMLGDSGRSYVVGVGQNYPKKPRDRGSSCPALPATCNERAYLNPNANPYLLVGALVSGPSFSDYFYDDRMESKTNQVSVENNAGFQSAV